MKKSLVLACVVVGAASFSTTALGAVKQLWNDTKADAAASDIAGVSVQAFGEDDSAEWASFIDPSEDASAVLGFTYAFEPPSSLLYRKIFISPDVWPTLADALDNPAQLSQASPSTLYTAAEAFLTLTHEAYHIRLMSSDENRVNACALQALPTVLPRDYGVPASTTTVATVPVTKRVRVKRRVRAHRHWVIRYRWKTVQTYEQSASTTPNPTYATLLADAHDLYTNHQDSSYNTGTCW